MLKGYRRCSVSDEQKQYVSGDSRMIGLLRRGILMSTAHHVIILIMTIFRWICLLYLDNFLIVLYLRGI